MSKQFVEDFIREAKERGKTEKEIRMALSLQPGVTQADIDQAFAPIPEATPFAGAPVPPPTQAGTMTPPPTPVPPIPSEGVYMHAPVAAPMRSVKGIIFALVVVVVLLGAAGLAYAQYTGLYSISWLPVSSEKVWQKFLGKTSTEPLHTEFSLSYTDAGSEAIQNPFGGVLKNVRAEVKGTGYANGAADIDTIQSSSSITYTLGSGNTSFSTGLEYRVVGKALYLNVGNNPFLSAMMLGVTNEGGDDAQKKFEWLRFSLDPKDYESLGSDEDSKDFKRLADQRYWQDVAAKWKDEHFLETPKYVGKETVRGVPTLHYKTNIKKETLRQAITEVIAKVVASEDKDTQEEVSLVVNGLLDKLEVQSLDVWVGQKDAAIRKLVVVSNAPSVASMVKVSEDMSKEQAAFYEKACGDYSKPCSPPVRDTKADIKRFIAALQFSAQFNLSADFYDYGKTETIAAPKDYMDIMEQLQKARGASRDAKRLADVRQLASALELYFNDNSRYPGSLEELTKSGAAYQYIGVLPTAPEPQDGSCTAAQNKYVYTPAGPTNYQLKFCLGAQTGGYGAGPHILSASGIQ